MVLFGWDQCRHVSVNYVVKHKRDGKQVSSKVSWCLMALALESSVSSRSAGAKPCCWLKFLCLDVRWKACCNTCRIFGGNSVYAELSFTAQGFWEAQRGGGSLQSLGSTEQLPVGRCGHKRTHPLPQPTLHSFSNMVVQHDDRGIIRI